LILNREARRGVAPSKTPLLPRLRKKGVRLIHNNQQGFTLIELIIAIAITGIITGGITMTIFQVFDGNTRSSNHMIAVRQVQDAGYWVSHDGQMAQSVVVTGVSGFPLTLTWTDWDNGDVIRVEYTLDDITNELQREYFTNMIPDNTLIVAEYIDPDNTKCEFTGSSAFSLPDDADVFTITDDVGGDEGTITVTTGSVTVTGTGTWADPNWSTTAGQTIIVTATAANTQGIWTSTAATAAITTDTDLDATLADGGVLVFTVTATVGTGSQESSETRVYEVMPRPDY